MRLFTLDSAESPWLGAGASREVAARMDQLARSSDFLANRPARLGQGDGEFQLDRFIFEGPHGGGDPISIAFFAGIHGDEPAGSHALVRLAEELARHPSLAEGYRIYLYPVCNPGGFDAGTRCSLSGKDLNREFWRQSGEPEVRLLEREILEQTFQGLVSLHSDDTSPGVYGFVRGAVLARSLLEPVLAAAERILPLNREARIDGFAAENGIVTACYEGILTSPPKLEKTPFEIILETPQQSPMEKQIDVFVSASLTILAEYRKFMAFAADL